MNNIAQRLFGHTIIDALRLRLNAWYIDGEQVTATAEQLNSFGTTTPTVKSITASKLGPGLTGPGLTGGNGSAISYDPNHLHILIGRGLSANDTLAVPGMAVGDSIVSVLEFTFPGTITNSASKFKAGADVATKTNGINNGTGATWFVWVDYT